MPRLVVLAWALALAALAGLGFAVAHYLSSGSSDMHGMQMGTAHALTRAGATSPAQSLSGARLVTAWQLDAVAVAVLVLAAAAYLTGVALLPVRSPGLHWPKRRTAAFLAGLAVCAYATCGSVAVYDQVLFSAHMIGHLCLIMVTPALVVAGRPLSLLLAASPPARRARLERIARGRVVALLTAPPVALATYALVLVGTHLTGLMDVIMRNTWAGQLEHLVFLVVGYQFFVLIVGDEPIRWRLASPARWLLLAIGMAVDTFTGIILMQGSTPVELVRSGLHVNALSDTRTGGAIMWFGGDAIMAVIMVILVIEWLRNVEHAPAEQGWLAQARGAAFAANTGAADTEIVDDEDEAARAAYNQWLSKLDR